MEKSRKPKIRFKGFTDDWEQRELGDIVGIYDGVHQTPNYQNSGVMFLSVEKIATLKSSKFISEEDFKRDYKIYPQENDILMTRIGDVGTTNVVTDNGLKAYYVSLALLKYKSTDPYFLSNAIQSSYVQKGLANRTLKTAIPMKINKDEIGKVSIMLPLSATEQRQIGSYFHSLDNLITLHQCEPKNKMEDNKMLGNINNQILFCDYYEKWIKVYKEGAIRKVTLEKYYMTHRWLKKLIPELKICEMTRINYQQLLNDYALYHERQTTMDFHHQLKGAILDAVDEGLLDRDPTRKAIIKGKTPAAKKIKYINQFELHTLLNNLNLKSEISWDWFILIVAKTGLRFSEALALTPKDFDFSRQSISVSKTWDYKGDGGFLPTKNKSSVRKVQIDWQTVIQFSELIKGLPEDKPIFVNGKVYNSTVNDILARYCKKANVPVISVHGLRHTHASLLLFAGVSIASVARRLGHSSMNTTQKTYLHIIQELESQDVDLVMRSLSGLS